MEGCERIVIFTDSLAMARRVVDPTVHSEQEHSLDACKTLRAWLSVCCECRIDFVETPSKLKWGLQHRAHKRACSLPPIPSGARPATSLDYVHKGVTDSALNCVVSDRTAVVPRYIKTEFKKIKIKMATATKSSTCASLRASSKAVPTWCAC
jgi:hypothetical protein